MNQLLGSTHLYPALPVLQLPTALVREFPEKLQFLVCPGNSGNRNRALNLLLCPAILSKARAKSRRSDDYL